MIFTLTAFLTGLLYILCEYNPDWSWLRAVGIVATFAAVLTL